MTALPPEAYPKRILVALCGLSPQVVTETIYALAVEQTPPYLPTEVHLLTTAEGSRRARLTLLSRDPGYFRRLCREYELGRIRFDESHIHELRDPAGAVLEDIRAEEHHRCAANQITEWIRSFTSGQDSSLHVSLAGGRKALGFYAGYALSLLGRAQDRLSHVLVTPHFESHPAFFYPPRRSHILYTPPPDVRPVDAHDARVQLAIIPFVRLRDHLPAALLSAPLTYDAAVHAAGLALARPELRIMLGSRKVIAGANELPLPPSDVAFLAWVARAASPLECPADGRARPLSGRPVPRRLRPLPPRARRPRPHRKCPAPRNG
jgi:CRISPR-associated protein (TIGR02584 family)